MTELQSERLRLVALDGPALAAMINGRPALEKHLQLEPHGWQLEEWVTKEIQEAQHFWSRSVRENPEQYMWSTSWELILKSENISVGGMGFGGLPDAEGKVQIGYSLDMRHRGKGYAQEALRTLTTWAFRNPDVQLVFGDTPEDNIPSQKVLTSAGFVLQGKTDEGFLRWVQHRSHGAE